MRGNENYFFKRNNEETKVLEDLKDMKELSIEELQKAEQVTSLLGVDIDNAPAKEKFTLPPI